MNDPLNNRIFVFGACMPERVYSLRPGAYGLLKNKVDELLIVEAESGNYFLPGGGQKAGETLQQTLEREFLEETGLLVNCRKKICEAVQIAHAFSEETGYEKLCTFFHVESACYAPQNPTDYKLHWVSECEAKRLVYEEASRWAITQASAHKRN